VDAATHSNKVKGSVGSFQWPVNTDSIVSEAGRKILFLGGFWGGFRVISDPIACSHSTAGGVERPSSDTDCVVITLQDWAEVGHIYFSQGF
jgi:hypothetical protein